MKTPAAAVVATLLISPIFYANAGSTITEADNIQTGKEIALLRKKGNCLACHAIKGEKLPGNIGPPLINMKQRYPNKADLKAQIADATTNNPNSIMPPYIRHKILSKPELNKVVEYIYSL